MALSLFLRSSSRFSATPLLTNISRLSTSTFSNAAVPKPGLLRVVQTSLIKPAAQQNVVRSINLSAPKLSAAAHGNHDKLWTVERFLSAGLLALLPAAIIYPSQPLDALLAVSIVMHSHWGLEAIVVDYVRPIIFGNVIPKLAHGLLIAFSAATLAGLFYFIYNDIGIGNAVRKLWAVKAK